MVLVRSVICVTVLCLAVAAYAQGRSWNPEQGTFKPGESTYSPKAKIPNPRPIKAPGPDAPASVKGLSGRWLGWAGPNRGASVAVDVEELSAKEATVSYFFAADYFTTPYEYRFSAVIVGDELDGNIGGGTYVKLRLRPDGHADFMVGWSGQRRSGVLTKQ